MGDNMITLTQMLEPSAKSIQFSVAKDDSKEPHMMIIVFEDWKKAMVYYEEIKQVFDDGDMSLEFEKIDKKLKVNFFRKEKNLYEGYITVDYDPDEFIDFTTKVDPTDAYAVVFGSIVDGKLVLSLGTTGNRAIVFLGYKIL